MKFIRIAAALLGSVLAAQGQQAGHLSAESIEKFTGSKVSVGLGYGREVAGLLSHVSNDSVVLEPLKAGQTGARTLAVENIRSIRLLSFRDSKTARILRTSADLGSKIPAFVIVSPIIGTMCVEWLVTGKWPQYTP